VRNPSGICESYACTDVTSANNILIQQGYSSPRVGSRGFNHVKLTQGVLFRSSPAAYSPEGSQTDYGAFQAMLCSSGERHYTIIGGFGAPMTVEERKRLWSATGDRKY
jgi:hypothetical protein